MSRIIDKLKSIRPKRRESLNLLKTRKPTKTSGSGTYRQLIGRYQGKVIISTLSLLIISSLLFVGFKISENLWKSEKVVVEKEQTSHEMLTESNKKALQKFRAGNYAGAVEAWKSLILQFPENVDLQVNLALAYKKQKKIDLSLAALLKAVALDPTHGVAQNNLGLVAAASGDFPLAKKSLELAIVHEPNRVELLFNLASFYEKTANYELSMQYYRKFITHPKAQAQMVDSVKKRLPRLHSIYVLFQENERS